MMDGKKCLNLEKYSVEQSSCFAKLVQDKLKEKKFKKEIARKLVVISKRPSMMDHPKEVGHLNFTEMSMGLFPDNIRDVKDLDEVIDHEVRHLIANDKTFPKFHDVAKIKTIPKKIIDMRRPGHGRIWETV